MNWNTLSSEDSHHLEQTFIQPTELNCFGLYQKIDFSTAYLGILDFLSDIQNVKSINIQQSENAKLSKFSNHFTFEINISIASKCLPIRNFTGKIYYSFRRGYYNGLSTFLLQNKF